MIPGLGRSPGEGTGFPLQYSWASLVAQTVKNQPTMRERPGLMMIVGKISWRREQLCTPGEFQENSLDRGAWQATFHVVAKSCVRENLKILLNKLEERGCYFL